MDLNLLPNELLKEIISHLHIRDAKNISLTSKRMRSLALERIWSKPHFRGYLDTVSLLKKVSKFPIRELCTRDFKCSINEIVKTVPSLKSLKLDHDHRYWVGPKELENIKIPLKLTTYALKRNLDVTLFDQIVQVIKNNTLISLDLYAPYSNDKPFEPSEIQILSEKVHIPSLDVCCCRITDENIAKFTDVISSLKNCRVHLSCGHGRYFFTKWNLLMMDQKGIKISTIHSGRLRTERASSNLVRFIPVLKKLKHLEEFSYSGDEFYDGPPPLHRFVDLPIKQITTAEFKLRRGKIRNIVDMLTQMKSLKDIHIYHHASNNYRLSPDDLLLFKHLPVTEIEEEALDLSESNVPLFRDILEEMGTCDDLIDSLELMMPASPW